MPPDVLRRKRAARLSAALAIGAALLPVPTLASGVVGEHILINTMIIDDPFVEDEATLPTFSWLPQPSRGGQTSDLSTLGFEYDKRITENFGFAINDGYQWLRTPGAKTANGWRNLDVTLKYTPYVNDEHEFIVSVGAVRTFAGSGASGTNGAVLGNDASGSTTPTLYWGKGFGDLPVGWLRPFAITGTIGYQIADRELKTTSAIDPASGMPTTLFNNGVANQWVGGLSLQYSLLYLQSQVKDLGLPAFVNRLTPVVEMAWSSPASKPSQTATQYLVGLGIAYTEEKFAIGVEALIPGNQQTGSHAGFIAQMHLYFDDLFPTTLGKPVMEW